MIYIIYNKTPNQQWLKLMRIYFSYLRRNLEAGILLTLAELLNSVRSVL